MLKVGRKGERGNEIRQKAKKRWKREEWSKMGNVNKKYVITKKKQKKSKLIKNNKRISIKWRKAQEISFQFWYF